MYERIRLNLALIALGGLLACDSISAVVEQIEKTFEEKVEETVEETVEEEVEETVEEKAEESPPSRGALEHSMVCTGPLTLGVAKRGNPVHYRTPPGLTTDVSKRVVGLELPVKLAEETARLDIDLHLGEPTVGSVELPIGGDAIPRATVTLAKNPIDASARLKVTRADDVAISGVLTLKLEPEGVEAIACTIEFAEVPFEPFLDSTLTWGDERLSLVASAGSGDGPDRWIITLPSDVGGKLIFELDVPPEPGNHELPTDVIRAVLEGNDAAKVEAATLTVRRNRFETYDADVKATIDVGGAKTDVTGQLLYMTTWKIRSTRGAEARDAVNAP